MAAVIGIISGTIAIFQFVAGIFPSQTGNTAVVRIAAGLNGISGATQQDGDIESIYTFNQNQQYLGYKVGNYIGSGGFQDYKVVQNNNQQAPYVQIVAANNAICIPYATITWADGTKLGWLGDFGRQCGLEWYYSNVFPAKGRDPVNCVWIDKDHTNGIRAGMLFIHFPSFDFGDDSHSNTPSSYCGYPELRAYSGKGGSTIFKRDELDDTYVYGEDLTNSSLIERGDSHKHKHKPKPKPRRRRPDPRLVISADVSHNATELCNSPTSLGPDFVSLVESVYCDMNSSTTFPLCGENITSTCFDHVQKVKLGGDGGRVIDGKVFSEVIEW